MAVDRAWRQAWRVWQVWWVWLLAQDSGERVAES
ncbi:hypothetical protein PIN31009_02758 [Pandoraea iniqua]|nr:hypothetical protein PIN31009_02758 [Pandoraea iniqua]